MISLRSDFAAIVCGICGLFVGGVPAIILALAKPLEVVKVQRQLVTRLPAEPGPGDLIEAFAPLAVRFRDRTEGAECVAYADGEIDAPSPSLTWSAFLCFYDASPAAPSGRHALTE